MRHVTNDCIFLAWNAYQCNVNEELILQTAQQMKSLGLQAAGYSWINLDDCYATKNRSASGNIVAGPSVSSLYHTSSLQPACVREDPVKWPSGLKSTTSKVKKLGL